MFAQTDKSDLLAMNLELTAKEFQLFVVYQMECFEGGGVCRKMLKDIAETYHFAYDNLTRINASLLSKNWIEKTPEGVKCCDAKRRAELNPTAKNAVENCENSSQLTAKNADIQHQTAKTAVNSTAKTAVKNQNQLRKTQLPTAKNAGTEVANKDLEFKEFNLNTHTDADARGKTFEEIYEEEIPEETKPTFNYPVSEIIKIKEFEYLTDVLTSAQIGILEAAIRPKDLDALRATITIYQGNHNRARNRYLPERVATFIEIFEKQKAKLLEKKDAKPKRPSKPNTDTAGNKPRSNREIGGTRNYSKFDNFDPNKTFKT